MSPESSPSVAIVGPGAIGTTIAALLHEIDRTPLLCGRTSRDHLALHDGDRLITIAGPVRTDPTQFDRPVDIVFLAVKATQIEAAAAWLGALTGPETVVCVLQNGVEQLDKVAPHCRRGRIVPAIVWFPAQAQPNGSVRLRGDARLSLPDTPESRAIAEALQGTRCFVELAGNFESLAWRKLLQNAAAGLMALTHRRSGMFGRPDISRLALGYLQECLAVARAEGAELGDEVPQAILDKFQASPADMGTSILTDREACRPLEWDVRNGVVSRRGRAHGIPTPISDVLVPLLAAASDGPG
ncbi:oxidoreductase [Variovorax sp. NFACC27]|uniref:oxidoreductase n=1 Tax=unclassified Variovorax TaxID=663243 RepID=UPI000894CEDE|nr:oxidoreductase [Variovorax sp. YR750]MDP9606384.1 2-dehydropantoate 2-reductase [Variovorax paradoxus]SEF35086.1 2-dehydropantoate 2-reductase [Variovorax sp. NFACC28]SEG98631.1 2-dehydropantoate 2-reductase [Variovorax sp. NFACC29]SFE11964.1 2-dehydropantoate 2-reductase [Variovorax sp. NFACC26]SFH19025.1 2-dehydropantoate 2-reductase [Variovorax sp. NFACC27]